MKKLTLSEAAERTGLHISTLRQQASRGVLKAKLVGRLWYVTEDDLAAYVREHKGRVGRRTERAA